MTDLPKWKCHKVVKADKIVEFIEASDFAVPGKQVHWLLACGAEIVVDNDWIKRGAPKVGDYYVEYEDGYKSWSPAKAFEEGYTLIDAADDIVRGAEGPESA